MPVKKGFIREIRVVYKLKKIQDARTGAKITGPEKVFRLFQDLQNETKEKLLILNLDGKNKVLGFEVVALGSVNACWARPIEVFRSSFLTTAASAIIMHNHPSGDVKPSQEDIIFTKKLLNTARTIGLVLLDHIIIGHEGYYSFASEGRLVRQFRAMGMY